MWWQQITGPPRVNPWEDDPRIRAERRGQHDRINEAARRVLRDSMEARDPFNERIRESWRPRDAR